MASTAVATQPDDRLHHELEAEQQRTCDELEAKAIAWIEAHPVFEMSYTAPMVCAGEFLPELYTCSWKSLCVGMRFKRAIQEGDSAAELQDLVESVSLERVEVPDLEVPAGWSVTATPSHSSFKPGEDGQAVRMKSFDGETLRWTIDGKTFFALFGNATSTRQEACMCFRKHDPHDFFHACKDFRGVLHFESVLVAPPPAPPMDWLAA
mmetsp:Transcript_53040/g.106477  ORF Transcript_53040/g.106477 Transcript_53040/m.106477 type:complete len:208 (-) Transcript_53040:239-862(-)